MKQSEKKIEKKLRDTVKAKGGLSLKLLPFQFTGLPDRLVILPGGSAQFVETKSTGDTLSPRQKIVHAKLNALGFTVRIINKIEDIEKL